MRAVRFELRAELARRWRDVAGARRSRRARSAGCVAAAAGGRARAPTRSWRATATWSLATDVIVGNGGDFLNPANPPTRAWTSRASDASRRSPRPTRGMLVAERPSRAQTAGTSAAYVNVEVNPGARGDEAIDRWKLLAGRAPGSRPPEGGGRRRGRARRCSAIGLGDTFRMQLSGRAGRPVACRRRCGSSASGRTCSTTARSRFVTVSPAFYRAYGDRGLELSAPRNAIKVRLRRGSADLPAFQRAAERIAGGRDFQFTVEDDEAGQAAVGLPPPGAGALARAPALAGGAAVLLLLRRASRGRSSWSRERHRIAARPRDDADAARRGSFWAGPRIIGGTRGARHRPGGHRAVPTGAPRPGRRLRAAPRHRYRRDRARRRRCGLVLIAAFVPGCASQPFVRCGRARRHVRPVRPMRGSAPAGALARAGAPPTLVGGVRMAIPGSRGATAGIARATLLGATVLAVAVAVGRADRRREPDRTCWGRLACSGRPGTSANIQGARSRRRRRSPSVRADRHDQPLRRSATEAILDRRTGTRVGVAAYDPIKRTLVAHDARRPGADRGPTRCCSVRRRSTRSGVGLGRPGRRASRSPGSCRMTVVGRGILPETSFLSLGEGAAMTFAALKSVVPGRLRAAGCSSVSPTGLDREATLRRLESVLRDAPRRRARASSATSTRSVACRSAWRPPSPCLAAATLARTLRALGPTTPARAGGPQDARLHARAGASDDRMARDDGRRDRPRGRGAAGIRGRTLDLERRRCAPRCRAGPGDACAARYSSSCPRCCSLVNVVAALPGGLAARTKPAVVLRAE